DRPYVLREVVRVRARQPQRKPGVHRPLVELVQLLERHIRRRLAGGTSLQNRMFGRQRGSHYAAVLRFIQCLRSFFSPPMASPAYPAARIVAPKIQAHFARHVAEAVQRGETDLASVPDTETIESLIEAAFWASLRREENYIPRISL